MKIEGIDRRKMVALAKDVLKMLREKRIKAQRGTYFHAPTAKLGEFTLQSDAKGVLKKVKKCEGCALGGMMLAYLLRYDEASLMDAGLTICHNWTEDVDKFEGHRPSDLLERVTTLQQLNEIEGAFERTDGSQRPASYEAIEFGHRYATDAGRLGAIMKNIVKNKGLFIPPPLR